MKHEILIAGHGGQGIMLAGNILAQSAMEENKEVTLFPSYGAEMRGGTAKCFVIISDEKIGCPIVSTPNIKLIFNQLSFDKYVTQKNEDSFVLYDSSIEIKNHENSLSVPAISLAHDLGNIKIANVIMLGIVACIKKVVDIKTLEAIIKDIFEQKKKMFNIKDEILQMNLRALEVAQKFSEKLVK